MPDRPLVPSIDMRLGSLLEINRRPLRNWLQDCAAGVESKC